jgi:regulatory protein
MKITSIVKQKFNDEKYNIFIDNVFRFSATGEDVIKNSLKVDLAVDESMLERLIEACEYSKGFNYSLNLIERRDHTCQEIENKLKRKEYSEITIKRTIEKLKDLGFINDSKFSERYLNDSLKFKKNGMRKIVYEISQKGISKDDIALIEIDKEIEYKNAKALAEKKYRLISNTDKAKIREKLFRYLVTKGYEYDLIKKVVNEIINNDEEYGDF